MMAGNGRFESSPADPEDLNFAGSFPNGQRLSYANANLDRSGSFREGVDNRMFNSGSNIRRGGVISSGDFPMLLQVLSLDPITMGDQKYTPRSVELRRALGISFGSTTEDNLFGAAHSKISPPLATDELKRFRASVLDVSIKARVRAKKFNESLHNLNKYYEGLIVRKNQRKAVLSNERCGSNLMKMGSQTHRNPPDPLNQRSEDRAKGMVLNKRVRSSVTELRADGQNHSSMRQPSLTGKDNDLLRDGGEDSGFVEEKIRRLPAAGETWDKKMKRKRSVGNVFTRHMDGDGELRGITLQKLNNEPNLQSPDSQSFRLGSSNATSCTNNIDGTPLHPSLNCRLVQKNESEKASVLRDPTGSGSAKERLVVKGGIKLSLRDDNHVSPNLLAKGKGSRTPRGGLATAGNSSPNFCRMSGAVDGWDHRPNLTKVLPLCGTNNRKGTMPTSSSSPPMAQWVGQRTQKMSRTRRANLVSPVSNHDEVHMPSERCSPSDCGPRMASLAANGSLPSRALSNYNLVRLKNEKVSSPVRLSESEESGAVDNFGSSVKEKRSESVEIDERASSTVSNIGCSLMLAKKKKLFNKEDISDFARRQGRSGRGSSHANISSPKEKLEAPFSSKLIKTMKPCLEKNGSKSGRPLKKISDRKAFTRLGHASTGTIPDVGGESDDDREELLAAANLARNSTYTGCSSTFWRKMEPYFSLVGSDDVFFLKQQLKAAEEKQKNFSQMSDHDKSFLGDGEHENNSMPLKQLSARNNILVMDQNGSELMSRNLQLIDRDLTTYGGEYKTEKMKRFPPLYERVLAALIAVDEIEEQESHWGRNSLTQYDRDDFSGARSMLINSERRNGVSNDFDSIATLGIKSQTCATERIFCNGKANVTNFKNRELNGEFFLGDHVFAPLRNGSILELPENGFDESLNVPLNSSAIASFHCPWEEMCLEDKLLLELQSIGLCTETLPNLSDGEEDALNQAILDLEKKYHNQVGTVKFHLNKLTKVEDCMETNGVNLEEKAVDELVQLSYRKLLATRGSIASKFGVQKETKQSAVSFMKKALSRCRLYEETGKSCFCEPPLLDALLAEPRHKSEEDTICALGSLDAKKLPHRQISNLDHGSVSSGADQHEHNDRGERGLSIPSELDFAKTGTMLNRGRKKEVLLDDVGGLVPSRASSTPNSTLLGGTKGKRSERDRDKGMLSRNSVAKIGRLSVNVKGECKAKSKPKQKIDQLSPLGNKFSSTFSEATHSDLLGDGNVSNRKRESDLMADFNTKDSPKIVNDPLDIRSLPMNDFESIELSITNDLGGPQDIGSWLSFDDDGLQGHDSVGLDIPMDDLSDLNMLL